MQISRVSAGTDFVGLSSELTFFLVENIETIQTLIDWHPFLFEKVRRCAKRKLQRKHVSRSNSQVRLTNSIESCFLKG
jgi:hypothetical protein